MKHLIYKEGAGLDCDDPGRCGTILTEEGAVEFNRNGSPCLTFF